ncbi:MAG: T9SS type A sorting domain-containing protein [Ignavibacteriae bacterium]|nr:T9SS type A sorting domain-containing protein [Ignavibacteriota bacterium]
MLKKTFSAILFILLIFHCSLFAQRTIQYSFLNANNISTVFSNTGIFNKDPRTANTPGFEWPKGSGKFAFLSSGLCLSARVNGFIRQAMASYNGEFTSGYCIDSTPFTNSNLKIYKVSAGDNQNTNPDWANWGLMVPFGAPYRDVNNNGIYEPAIDTPGVKNAASTIFICMTDGFSSTHTSTEGFGGGTLPLYAEIHLTAWCYSQPSYNDMQFMKYEIINKGKRAWNGTYLSFVCDPNLGYPLDDYVGCDTIRKLSFCLNGRNTDSVYGIAPPAAGIVLLKGLSNKSITPNVDLGLTSFAAYNSFNVTCETNPANPLQAYLFMKGYKNDSSAWLDATNKIGNYYVKTKYCYSGNPEYNTGWIEKKGRVENCNRDSTGIFYSFNNYGNRKFLFSSGSDDLIMNPGDTQVVYLGQLVARGTTDINSVTKLKELSINAIELYLSGFVIGIRQISSSVPDFYKLYQNYPNPFNPLTKIEYQIINAGFVSLIIYDVNGRKVENLVNEKQSTGIYEATWDASNYPSGVYFYKIQAGDFSETKRMILIK